MIKELDHSFVYQHKRRWLKAELVRLRIALLDEQEKFDSDIHFETGDRFQLDNMTDRMKELQDEIIIKERELSHMRYEIAN